MERVPAGSGTAGSPRTARVGGRTGRALGRSECADHAQQGVQLGLRGGGRGAHSKCSVCGARVWRQLQPHCCLDRTRSANVDSEVPTPTPPDTPGRCLL